MKNWSGNNIHLLKSDLPLWSCDHPFQPCCGVVQQNTNWLPNATMAYCDSENLSITAPSHYCSRGERMAWLGSVQLDLLLSSCRDIWQAVTFTWFYYKTLWLCAEWFRTNRSDTVSTVLVLRHLPLPSGTSSPLIPGFPVSFSGTSVTLWCYLILLSIGQYV
jgi:hypothetical protein